MVRTDRVCASGSKPSAEATIDRSTPVASQAFTCSDTAGDSSSWRDNRLISSDNSDADPVERQLVLLGAPIAATVEDQLPIVARPDSDLIEGRHGSNRRGIAGPRDFLASDPAG